MTGSYCIIILLTLKFAGKNNKLISCATAEIDNINLKIPLSVGEKMKKTIKKERF